MRFLEWMQALIARVVTGLVGGGLRDLKKLIAAYERLTDEDLVIEYQREAVRLAAEPDLKLLRVLQRYRNTPEASIMAISVVAFNRKPADLPVGSTAYEQQVFAARNLVDQVNVQMETGEGKTYAIALALPTIVARYGQAMVMTVNDYLAERDRKRVTPYLEFLGIEVGSGMPGPEFRGVSYVQFSTAAFGYMYTTYGNPTVERADYPRGAGVILDEIDSILIDGDNAFNLSEHLAVEESGWAEVAEVVASWTEGAHFTFDRMRDESDLTPAGWRQVQLLAGELMQPAQRIHHMAEAVVWASFAQEGRDYIMDGEAIMKVNPTTGALSNQNTSLNVKALRYKLTGKLPWVDRIYAEVSRLELLGKHPFVVGLSGTASSDFLYYQILFKTLTVAVPARFPRSRDKAATRFFSARSETLDAVAAEIDDREGSPTVVICWSVAEALHTAAHLRSARPADVVNVLTVFDSDSDSEIVERAGDPGVITVLSTGGCRGVDIRSHHTPHLVILGHGQEPRLDRQVLGRVGRHGESFTAEFIEDPETALVRSTAGLKRNLDLQHKYNPGEIKLGRQVGRQFRQLQMQWWRGTSARRGLTGVLGISERQAEDLISAQFIALREAVRADDVDGYVRMLDTPPEQRAEVFRSMERRVANDAAMVSLKASLDSLPGPLTPFARPKVELDAVEDDSAVVAEIDDWARSLDITEASRPEIVMLRNQVKTMSGLRFRLASAPDSRTVLLACYPVLKNACISYLSSKSVESGRVWVNYSGATYYRKLAVLYLTHAARVAAGIAPLTMDALRSIDNPIVLGSLFPATATYPTAKSRRNRSIDPMATKTERPAHVVDTELIDGVIQDIAADLQPGLFGAGPSAREIVLHLHVFAVSLARRLPYMTAEQVDRELGLELQRQIAAGYTNREVKVFYLAATRLINELEARGIGKVRVRESSPTVGARLKARAHLARTIAGVYLLGLLACLSIVFGAAAIPTPAGPAWLEKIGDVMAAGWLDGSAGSLASVVLGVLIIVGLALDATSVIDKHAALPALAPLVSAVIVVWIFTSVGGIGIGLLFGLGVFVWVTATLTLRRFTFLGSAVDPLHIFAGVSVLGYLAIQDYTSANSDALFSIAWLLVAIALASGVLFIPIGRAERAEGQASGTYRQVLSSMRVAIDPHLRSVFVAFVVTWLFLPWLGALSSVAFAVLQTLLFLLWAWFRTRVGAVQKVLARREYAQTDDEATLRRILNRRFAISCLIFSPIAIGSVALAVMGRLSPESIALAELSGLALMLAWRELGGIVGGGPSDRNIGDAQLRREQRTYAWQQVKALVKRPAGKVGLIVLAIPVAWNLLTFFMDIWSLPQFIGMVWKWLTGS